MNYLAIDRKISKTEFLRKDNKDKVLDRMNQKNILDSNTKNQIDKIYDEILDPQVVVLTSIRTPFSKILPLEFNFAFNYFDLNQNEKIKIEIIGSFAYGAYFSELPLGHHCAIICKIENPNSLLLSLLPTDKYYAPFLYICQKSDFESLRINILKEIKESISFKNYKEKHLQFLRENLLI